MYAPVWRRRASAVYLLTVIVPTRPRFRAAAPPIPLAAVSEADDPVRKTAFRLGLALVFLRFSMLHQIQSMLMHVNLRLLYLVGIPALLGVLVAGGIRRTFRGRPAVYWTAFAVWMVLATPFSSWIGGSASFVLVYLRTNIVMLFVVAGLAVTWRECRQLMYVIGASAVINALAARLFQSEETAAAGRLSLDVGTIANSNDYAAHMLLVIPFLLWIGLSSRWMAVRLAACLGVAYGIFIILDTGSRGGTIGLCAGLLFFLWRGTARQRIALLALGPVALVALLALVPGKTLERIRTITADTRNGDQEAIMSSESRQYLLRKSVLYALEHPLFGVGPGQFASYEGRHNIVVGTHGLWHEAHNSFTQAASECGIPALVFFLAGIVSTWRLLSATCREASRRPDCRDIQTTTFCIMLAMAGFLAAITFLNFAYFFYLPALAGLAIATHHAAREQFRSRAGARGRILAPVLWPNENNRWRNPAAVGTRQPAPRLVPNGTKRAQAMRRLEQRMR